MTEDPKDITYIHAAYQCTYSTPGWERNCHLGLCNQYMQMIKHNYATIPLKP